MKFCVFRQRKWRSNRLRSFPGVPLLWPWGPSCQSEELRSGCELPKTEAEVLEVRLKVEALGLRSS